MSPRLIATSEAARRAIYCEFLTIDRQPFRVGRESRSPGARPASAVASEAERRKGTVSQSNDVYLFEDPLARYHHVWREHFLIDAEHGQFRVADRRSVYGTIVNGRTVNGDRAGGRIELDDQDVIVAGTAASPSMFKFVVG